MNIVYNQDCLPAMKAMPDKAFDLAIVDIPYGINVGKMAYLKEMKTTVKQKNGNRLNGNAKKRPYASKEWDKETPSQYYFNELVRVSNNQIIFGIDYVNWIGVGKGRIKWDKGISEGMSFNRYETAYCSMINDQITIPLLWAGMCQAKSLNEPMTQQGNKKLNETRIHPCHKPILLYKKLLSLFASAGDTILDTHVGSGSIRIACDQLGFSFTGYEIDKDYFEAQELRFARHKSQLNLFV